MRTKTNASVSDRVYLSEPIAARVVAVGQHLGLDPIKLADYAAQQLLRVIQYDIDPTDPEWLKRWTEGRNNAALEDLKKRIIERSK